MALEVLFATTNINKIREAEAVLKEFGVRVKPIAVTKIEIQHNSLEEIARFAAIQVYTKVRTPVAVEDSGLFIEKLNGFPGPYSSYVYKTIGLKGILKLLEDYKDWESRKATFIAVIAYALSENNVVVFKGVTEGHISFEIRGGGGFGYDPIFIPQGSIRTFAEMSIEEKSFYSHRGKAFRAFGEWLIKNSDILSKAKEKSL
ncbi:MAG: XTP/dITP diphosphatase [Ignisphaera sp.]|jgi:XTP/dITP diphosphohydrolase|nr:XTP/dITP diphosphatase [Ignisphaera sp.]MCC6056459.1 XTP/dITP diphosphatase [Desulfurococcaceae archaeon]